MNCRTIQACLPEFTKGMLDAAETARIEQHIRQCASCREEYENITQTIAVLGEFTDTEEISPEAYEGSIWHELYGRIRKENLHIKSRTVPERARDFILAHRPGALQIVNALIIAVAGGWFYYSFHADEERGRINMIQSLVEKSTPLQHEKIAEQFIQKKDDILDVVTRTAIGADLPIDRLKEYLDSDKQQHLYDTLTDYLAEMVIRFSENS